MTLFFIYINGDVSKMNANFIDIFTIIKTVKNKL